MNPIFSTVQPAPAPAPATVSDEDLKFQFSRLTKKTPHSTRAGQEYFYRNRYPDVMPFDHNRVILEGEDFYYNASYVLGGRAIAAQAPREDEIHDFWRIIWEKDCSLIVMLTNLVEQGKKKSSIYWTDDADTNSFFFLPLSEEVLYDDGKAKIIKRVIQVEQEDTFKEFTQLHLVGWNDQQTISPETLKELVLCVHQVKNGEGPLLVHCSAGVGRAGTFLAVEEAYAKGDKSVFEIIESLRNERIGMVQTPEQYILAQRTAELLAKK